MSITLCHEIKAKQPYHIVRVDLNVYTVEELCYYLFHNLYLIDRTIMSEKLCDWLEQELQMKSLAGRLRKEVEFGLSVQGFILPIFEETGYCTEKELRSIKAQLQIFKRQTETERRKHRADNLIRNGQYGGAIKEYNYILMDKRDEKLKTEFICSVYHNLGTAYARMFLFETAAKMYYTAYEYVQSREILKQYVLASKLSMQPEEYQELLDEERDYQALDDELKKIIDEAKELQEVTFVKPKVFQENVQLEQWRNEYEKSIFM